MTRLALKTLNGSCLSVEIKGGGPAILAIHGFTGNGATWDFLYEAVRTEYSLVCPDMLGHGASDSPGNPLLYDMEHTIVALREMLDRLAITRVHWLGYSMGGRIALAAAIALSERTYSLTMESASPGLSGAEERDGRRETDEALAQQIEQRGIREFTDYWESLPLWQSQASLPAAVREGLRAQRLTNNPAGLANSLRGLGTGRQPALYDRLHIKTPTLFVAGEEDIKYVTIAQAMHRAVTGSRIKIVLDSGHAVHMEQPEIFNRTIFEFSTAGSNLDLLPSFERGACPAHNARTMLSQQRNIHFHAQAWTTGSSQPACDRQ